MTDYSLISFEVEAEVAHLTLRRPKKLNAITDQMNIELFDALNRISETPAIKIVVITGEGRAFSAGYDVGEGEDMPARTPAYWRHHFHLAFRTLRRIWSLPQPVIAKVNGACLGGGMALAMASDLVYASEGAFFGDPEIKFGGGGNMFPVLQWIIGMKKLNELVLTGRNVQAPEALSLGMINEMLSADQLDARVAQITRHMCLLPDGTLVKNKASAHRWYEEMGIGPTIRSNEDASVLGLSTGGETEFTRISKADGVSAALRWQKSRFQDVGAF
ncbi:enoyl-CoA hydratase/isomerase family protein [Mesorhizobium sp. CAU 1732]|uniref:enoyl-CoA hydratase/isomerase family protein n=1 Tax=Mesorhizobium sp. CAU 1732 TaxID=3140358 RepID=UPI00325FE519